MTQELIIKTLFHSLHESGVAVMYAYITSNTGKFHSLHESGVSVILKMVEKREQKFHSLHESGIAVISCQL